MKTLHNAMPLLALAALAATGCFLVSGQFVVNYALPTVTSNSSAAVTNIVVDLNTIGDYSDHKSDLKRVDDLALVGDFVNNDTNAAVTVEAWVSPVGQRPIAWTGTSPGDVRLWGPLTIPSGSTVTVDWNRSAGLFVGRQTLIDEIKGDGQFALYLKGTGASFNVTLTKAALIAVIGAAK